MMERLLIQSKKSGRIRISRHASGGGAKRMARKEKKPGLLTFTESRQRGSAEAAPR